MTDMMKNYEMADEDLAQAAGGNDASSKRYVTGLATGYLALRSEPTYNPNNELGALVNGDYVTSSERYQTGSDGNLYVKVDAICDPHPEYGKAAIHTIGWVNAAYLGPVVGPA